MVQITNGTPFCQKPFEVQTKTSRFQMVCVFEWLRLQLQPQLKPQLKPYHLKTGPKQSGFQNFPDFKWSDFRAPLYWVHGTIQLLHKEQSVNLMSFNQIADYKPVLLFLKYWVTGKPVFNRSLEKGLRPVLFTQRAVNQFF